MIGSGSDATDSILFEEIFELSADEVAAVAVTTISGKPCVAKVILKFSMVALEVDMSLETPLSTLSEHLSQLETLCQGTDLHSQDEGEPRAYAAIPRGVKKLLAATSGFPGRDCTVAPSALSPQPF